MSVFSSRYTSTDSRPSLTRESTALSSESAPLPTPTDYPAHLDCNDVRKNTNPGVSIDSVQIQTPTRDRHGVPLSRVGSPTSFFVQDRPAEDPSNDSYFPVPATRAPETPIRQRSTKELISRYETMSPRSISSPGRASHTSSVQHNDYSPDPFAIRPPLAPGGKGRSPLRDSFRNLISLFGKKGKGKDDDCALLSSRYEPSVTSSSRISGNTYCSSLLDEHAPSIPGRTRVLHTGPVLYLSRATSDQVLPVWTNCKASLFEDHILLEWLTAYGNPSSSVIILGGSTDVHSLARSQANPTEKSLLPNAGQDAHIFEITYTGRPPEKFALFSVAERSAWVSSIWDVLLQLSGSDSSKLREEVPSKLDFATKYEELRPASSLRESQPGSCSPSLAEVSNDFCDIPPTPTASIYDSDCFSAPEAPIKVSQLGTRKGPYASRSSSPSIRNLGNLSLVRSHLSKLSDDTGAFRAPSKLSRQNTLEPSYSTPPSHAPSYLATPQSLRADTTHDLRSRVQSSTSDSRDDDSIYEFYAHKPHARRTLSPVLDASESQAADTPRAEDTFFTDGGATDDLKRRISQKTTFSRLSKASSTLNRSEDDAENGAHPLITLIQDHAVQQYSQTSDLGHQIASLQNDVLEMSSDLRATIAEQNPDSALRGLLEDLCTKMEMAAAVGKGDSNQLKELNEKMDSIKTHILMNHDEIQVRQPHTSEGSSGTDEKELILRNIRGTVDEVHLNLRDNMPIILDRLAVLHQGAVSGDSSQLNAKLDELLEACKYPKHLQLEDVGLQSVPGPSKDGSNNNQTKEAQSAEKTGNPEVVLSGGNQETYGNPEVGAKLTEVLELLKNDEEQKKLRTEQQAESIRYLHELNTWLQSFVDNGTAQIQSVAQGVEHLCRELSPQIQTDVGSSVLKNSVGAKQKHGGLRSELSDLITSVKAGEEKSSSLQTLLTEVLEENRGRNAEIKTFHTETVIGMIDRQRQEQEAMLRGIAAELSNEIRGERLRFVEAMKEATAINVQVHVEEFKKELGREVMMMTCEVGRLQRERQMLEQQIADLFAFFAKQRAEMNQEQGSMERSRQTLQLPQAQPIRSSSRGRPLPIPK
ncbi:hypothetical protein M0805_006333 [Coniferiporia weirii]|nr:hypothetical protein M0805_006333 [Coniferiporia weirii]